MLHAGIDMHKEFLVITVLDDDGEPVIEHSKVLTEEPQVKRFFEELTPDVRAVLEAGPNWYWLCDLLDEMGIDNTLCHPLKTRAIASARIKTDKLDSRVLADLRRTDFIAESYKPPIETRYLRELMRSRTYLVNLRTSAKNRTHNILAKRNIKHDFSDLFSKRGMRFLRGLELPEVYRDSLDSCLSVIELLTEEIKAAEARAAIALANNHGAQLLSTIPGVGLITSLMIVAEVGEVSRFPSAKKLCSFAGLVPATWQSGGTTRHGRITRQGSRLLRWVLVESIRHVATRPGPLHDFYQRTSKRKGKSTAKVATARKLCTYVYHMLEDDVTYERFLIERQRRSGGSPFAALGSHPAVID